jgi:hypothetical protein
MEKAVGPVPNGACNYSTTGSHPSLLCQLKPILCQLKIVFCQLQTTVGQLETIIFDLVLASK